MTFEDLVRSPQLQACARSGPLGNQQAMDAFRTEAIKGWLHALRRRSHKGANLTWQRLQKWIRRWMPSARVTHPYLNQRLCV